MEDIAAICADVDKTQYRNMNHQIEAKLARMTLEQQRVFMVAIHGPGDIDGEFYRFAHGATLRRGPPLRIAQPYESVEGFGAF